MIFSFSLANGCCSLYNVIVAMTLNCFRFSYAAQSCRYKEIYFLLSLCTRACKTVDGIEWNNDFFKKYVVVTDINDYDSLVKSVCGVDLSLLQFTDERFETHKKYYLCLSFEKSTGFIPYGLQPKDVVLNGFGEACKIIEYSDSNYNIAYVCFELPELFKTYTVSFNANGGSGSMASVTVKEGEFTLPVCEFTAPKKKQSRPRVTTIKTVSAPTAAESNRNRMTSARRTAHTFVTRAASSASFGRLSGSSASFSKSIPSAPAERSTINFAQGAKNRM